MTKIPPITQVTKFKTPEDSPGYLLWLVSLAWRSTIETTLKKFGLTHPQFVVLATTAWLTRAGAHTSQIAISQAAGIDPNTTSQILRGLELKQLIQRPRFLNERSRNPALTALGLAIITKALPAVERADTKFFRCLDASEHGQLLKIFRQLKTNV